MPGIAKWSLILCAAWSAGAQPAAQLSEVEIRSSHDGVVQKARWWAPAEARERVPLLVALHSWSGNYTQKESEQYLERCRARGWALIHPDFRGENRTPQACGSDLVAADIVDAVAWARARAKIDPARIYLAGVSGGGYLSLVMAHRQPRLWAAVTSWVPISDLAVWYRETTERKLRYPKDMDGVFGGPPGEDAARDAEYRRRSPLFFMKAARAVALDINAGIHDGHTGSVPVSHTLRAFNVLAEVNGHPESAIAEADIAAIVAGESIPAALGTAPPDPAYSKPVLLRREAGPARVTIFEGTHEMLMDAAFAWLERHKHK